MSLGSHDAPGEPAGTKLPPGLRVLVAEDNRANQMVARAHLRKLGCEIELVENGQMALERVTSGDFDLILMDCQMPVLDGFAATREIRALPGLAGQVPIVAMTARSGDGDRQSCLDSGMNGFVMKPVEREELAEVLRQFCLGAEVDELSVETGAAEDAVFSPEALLDRLGGDAEFAEEAASLYLQDTPRILDRLARAAAEGDERDLAAAAHALAGTSLNIGAEKLGRRAKRLENLVEEGQLEEGLPLVPEIEQEGRDLLELLRRVDWRALA